jgi:hypothetical protein
MAPTPKMMADFSDNSEIYVRPGFSTPSHHSKSNTMTPTMRVLLPVTIVLGMFTIAGLMYLIHKCLQYTLKKIGETTSFSYEFELPLGLQRSRRRNSCPDAATRRTTELLCGDFRRVSEFDQKSESQRESGGFQQ